MNKIAKKFGFFGCNLPDLLNSLKFSRRARYRKWHLLHPWAEWLLSLETVLAELVKMGNANDAYIDLTRSVFGPQTTSIIIGKYPPVLKQRLVRAAKSDPCTEKLVT